MSALRISAGTTILSSRNAWTDRI